jgi:hypothetical protein
VAGRLDFYFRQRVTEAELDLAFELLEKADRDFASDIGIFGVVSGGAPAPHEPVADLSIDLTGPLRAYDAAGQRVFVGVGQTINCATDSAGLPTDVASAANERWVSVFVRFRRALSDPRTDGNSQQVFFRRDESFEFVVRQAPVGPIGSASRVDLVEDEVLVCDVKRRAGQVQIVASDIDTTRRQAFVLVRGSSIGIEPGLWSTLAPAAPDVQAALDAVDDELTGHFAGSTRRHPASDIDLTPHGLVTSGDVQAGVEELVDKLTATADAASGTSRIGADGLAGTPVALGPGTARSQLATLLAELNEHLSATTGAHAASAIGALAHGFIAGTNVQAQLEEIITDLAATSSSSGASRIGVADAGSLLTATQVEAALAEIVGAYDDDHFRATESNAGMHRAIRQPNFGGSKALLWDAQGTGSTGTRLRVYADSETVWFVFNASWNGSAWARDSTSLNSGGFRVGRNEFEVLHTEDGSGTFTTWTRTMRFPISNSSTPNTGIEATGTVREVGKCGARVRNFTDSDETLGTGHGVTFRVLFPSAPSSITFTAHTTSPIVPTVNATSITREGFGFWFAVEVPDNSSILWFGNYTAID